jgi:hypothetical protein
MRHSESKTEVIKSSIPNKYSVDEETMDQILIEDSIPKEKIKEPSIIFPEKMI